MYTPFEGRYGQMEYRRCGRSGVMLPAISLGLWHNFGAITPFETQRELLRTAFDCGITHFDLANNYGPPYGEAEHNFGVHMERDWRPHRDELFLSTKAGYDMWPGPYGDGGSRKYLISSLNQSLKRMRVEYVDVFYHHRPDPDTPLEETMGALDAIVRSGKALYALDRACFSAGQNAQYSMNVGEEKAPTLVAEGPGAVAAPAAYLVRRLTPGECCRLQGYPDGWCENLESPAPSNKETDRWELIFEEWRTAMGGKTKPQTRRQIIRWLQNPHTDSAEYKAYGNSIVAQCGFFVLAGIVWATEEGEQNEND